eukprot:RCo009507
MQGRQPTYPARGSSTWTGAAAGPAKDRPTDYSLPAGRSQRGGESAASLPVRAVESSSRGSHPAPVPPPAPPFLVQQQQQVHLPTAKPSVKSGEYSWPGTTDYAAAEPMTSPAADRSYYAQLSGQPEGPEDWPPALS